MVALTVAAEEEYLVLDVLVGLLVQLLDLVVEAFPLSGVLAIVLELLVGGVGAVDEAKVDSSLYTQVKCILDRGHSTSQRTRFRCSSITYVVKGRWISGSLILQEVSRHGGVFDRRCGLHRRNKAQEGRGQSGNLHGAGDCFSTIPKLSGKWAAWEPERKIDRAIGFYTCPTETVRHEG